MEVIFYMALMLNQNSYHPFAVQCKRESQAVITCQSHAPRTRICLPAFPIDEVGSMNNAKVFCKRSRNGYYSYEVVVQ